MTRKDLIFSLIVGGVSAWLILIISKNIEITNSFWQKFWWLTPFLLPVFTAGSLAIASLVAKKIAVVFQIAKFILVGGLNTLVDLGVLNLLIWFSGINAGWFYSAFKGISFVVAVVNSYFWNKFWTFRKTENQDDKIEGGEFIKFFFVSAVGFVINVGSASFIVNFIGPLAGFSQNLWANIGALLAGFIGLAWNFLGYKFIVFKK